MSENIIVPVSVIIPCYRCVSTILRAVESVACQTARPAELILVEDNSQDNTLNILKQLANKFGPDWIKIIELPLNVGTASARNIGWFKATQDYIALLDADDSWHPDKIRIQYDFMRLHTDVYVSGHLAKICLNNETEKRRDPVEIGGFCTVKKYEILLKNRFKTPTVMFKRELAYRFLDGRRHVDDHLLWMQIILSGSKTVLLNCTLTFIHKAMYGQSGLSSHLWEMEKGELSNYYTIYKHGFIGIMLLLLLYVYSLLKYIRRLVVVMIRKYC